MKGLFSLLTFVMLIFFVSSCHTTKKTAAVVEKNNYLKEVYQELKDSLEGAEVTQLKDTIKVLFPEHLLFDKGSSYVKVEIEPILNRFANAINKFTRTQILINGYTDNTGTDAINRKVSNQRAENVKLSLLNFDVSKSRLYTWGFGSKEPIANNDSENGRKKNRRVEFIVLYTTPTTY